MRFTVLVTFGGTVFNQDVWYRYILRMIGHSNERVALLHSYLSLRFTLGAVFTPSSVATFHSLVQKQTHHHHLGRLANV